MANLATLNDDETVILPAAEVFAELRKTMPPEEQLHLLAQQCEADKYKFERRTDSIRKDITELGLGTA